MRQINYICNLCDTLKPDKEITGCVIKFNPDKSKKIEMVAHGLEFTNTHICKKCIKTIKKQRDRQQIY